jgi:hypothetical protein
MLSGSSSEASSASLLSVGSYGFEEFHWGYDDGMNEKGCKGESTRWHRQEWHESLDVLNDMFGRNRGQKKGRGDLYSQACYWPVLLLMGILRKELNNNSVI